MGSCLGWGVCLMVAVISPETQWIKTTHVYSAALEVRGPRRVLSAVPRGPQGRAQSGLLRPPEEPASLGVRPSSSCLGSSPHHLCPLGSGSPPNKDPVMPLGPLGTRAHPPISDLTPITPAETFRHVRPPSYRLPVSGHQQPPRPVAQPATGGEAGAQRWLPLHTPWAAPGPPSRWARGETPPPGNRVPRP